MKQTSTPTEGQFTPDGAWTPCQVFGEMTFAGQRFLRVHPLAKTGDRTVDAMAKTGGNVLPPARVRFV